MKTITFCSHGFTSVNKTSLLLMIAKHLLNSGKKVFLMDMNLDDPSLTCSADKVIGELAHGPDTKYHYGRRGWIDFLLTYQSIGQTPDILWPYVTSTKDRQAFMFPAGIPPAADYIDKLRKIDYRCFFPVDGPALGTGLLVDTKYRISRGNALNFKPDYLLIDSATRITDFGIVDCMLVSDSLVWAGGGIQYTLNFLKERQRH